ncbi:MAG: hypothetical protein ACM3SV_11090 [Betaproteobacteria bacterium]
MTEKLATNGNERKTVGLAGTPAMAVFPVNFSGAACAYFLWHKSLTVRVVDAASK